MDKLKSELLSKEYPSKWEKFLKWELINGLEPEGDNEKRFQLINELLKISGKPYMKILEAFNQKVNEGKDRQADLLKKDLSVQGISGPAVIPNVDRDPAWKSFYGQEKQVCKEKLVGL